MKKASRDQRCDELQLSGPFYQRVIESHVRRLFLHRVCQAHERSSAHLANNGGNICSVKHAARCPGHVFTCLVGGKIKEN